MGHGGRLEEMLDELGQRKNGVQNTRTEHTQSPLYLAVDRYREFEQVLNKLLQHPLVVNRTGHLAGLFSAQDYDANKQIGAAPSDTAKIERELKSLVDNFRSKIKDGMQKRNSPLRPEELKDEHGRAVDRGSLVQYLDIKIGMLRTVIRGSIEQLLQRPAEDPRVDELLVQKILSLGSSEGINLIDKQDISNPLTRAVLSAFSDVISSPEFNPPPKLSLLQEQLLRGIFELGRSLGAASQSLLLTAMEAAEVDAQAIRRLFIRGEYDRKMPHELTEIKVYYAEKAVLSVIESVSRIACLAAVGQSSSGAINLNEHEFGKAEIPWIAPFVSGELAGRMKSFLESEILKQVIHRAHNVGNFSLYLSKASRQGGHTLPLWPLSREPNAP